MAKGSIAKTEVIQKIKEIFGKDYITTEGSKVYVWADDGPNGRVQIALALTCPKVMAGPASASRSDGIDFSEYAATPEESTEISEQERKNITELMKKLNL